MEEVDKYRDCISGYYDELAWARRERETFMKSDSYQTHGLPDEALEALRVQLANVLLLESAYLVKKKCKHFPQDTCYVLGVFSKRFLGVQIDNRDNKLVQQLATTVSYPGYTFIIPLEHAHKPLRKVFKRIEGAEIYRRSAS